ncbi:hypothetical protein ACFL08_02975 [Patescibacteria group bacterium]
MKMKKYWKIILVGVACVVLLVGASIISMSNEDKRVDSKAVKRVIQEAAKFVLSKQVEFQEFKELGDWEYFRSMEIEYGADAEYYFQIRIEALNELMGKLDDYGLDGVKKYYLGDMPGTNSDTVKDYCDLIKADAIIPAQRVQDFMKTKENALARIQELENKFAKTIASLVELGELANNAKNKFPEKSEDIERRLAGVDESYSVALLITKAKKEICSSVRPNYFVVEGLLLRAEGSNIDRLRRRIEMLKRDLQEMSKCNL